MTTKNMTRIRVRGLHGGAVESITVRPDTVTPGQIFFRGPRLASLTRDQAYELATALADILEETK